ncbi:MAG: hypothetical protein, partial [Olavius algarvensis Delta 4 endosymbiont]
VCVQRAIQSGCQVWSRQAGGGRTRRLYIKWVEFQTGPVCSAETMVGGIL